MRNLDSSLYSVDVRFERKLDNTETFTFNVTEPLDLYFSHSFPDDSDFELFRERLIHFTSAFFKYGLNNNQITILRRLLMDETDFFMALNTSILL